MGTLIIKLGALGDVVRTTPLLRVLEGDITWVTRDEAKPLLPRQRLAAALDLSAGRALAGARFDRVICLDEEPEAAALASSVEAGERIGTYLASDGSVRYTDASAVWFDMGLVSRAGKAAADRLKAANTRSYQDCLFGMLGRPFRGEEYLVSLAARGRSSGRPRRIGLEERAGQRWPAKRWGGFRALSERLRSDGHEVVFFRSRPTLEAFAEDIAGCGLVVCGDTLTLHLALALGIRTVALFTCTSAAEIHGYGRLAKVVSPLWRDHFYSRDPSARPGQAISVSQVEAEVRRAWAD